MALGQDKERVEKVPHTDFQEPDKDWVPMSLVDSLSHHLLLPKVNKLLHTKFVPVRIFVSHRLVLNLKAYPLRPNHPHFNDT